MADTFIISELTSRAMIINCGTNPGRMFCGGLDAVHCVLTFIRTITHCSRHYFHPGRAVGAVGCAAVERDAVFGLPRDDRPKIGETSECPQTHFLASCTAVRAPFPPFLVSHTVFRCADDSANGQTWRG